jgi:hypothetical protein
MPRGSAGLVGWQLTSSGAQVIPANPGSFLVDDGRDGFWQLDSLHTSGDWNVTGYNTGNYPHTVYLEFLVSPIVAAVDQAALINNIAGLAMSNLIQPSRN